MDHIRKNDCSQNTVKEVNPGQTRTNDQKVSGAHLVPSICSNTKFKSLLPTTELYKARTRKMRISQQERCCVPSRQRKATYVYSDSHPPLSLDLVSSNYCIFIALQNFVIDKKMAMEKIMKIDYKSFSLIGIKTSIKETL